MYTPETTGITIADQGLMTSGVLRDRQFLYIKSTEATGLDEVALVALRLKCTDLVQEAAEKPMKEM